MMDCECKMKLVLLMLLSIAAVVFAIWSNYYFHNVRIENMIDRKVKHCQ